MFIPIDGRLPTQAELDQAIAEFQRQFDEALDRQEAERAQGGEHVDEDDDDDDDGFDINVTVATDINVQEWQNADLNLGDAKIDVILLNDDKCDSNTRGNVVIYDIRTIVEKDIIAGIGQQLTAQLPPGFHFGVGVPMVVGGRLHAPSGSLYFIPPQPDVDPTKNNANDI